MPTQIRIQSASAALDRSQASTLKDVSAIKIPGDGPLVTFQEIRETTLAEMEQKYFQRLMELTKGSLKEACRISGLSRNRLYIYLKRHNITRFGWR
ncbi:MAG: hypothetical protein C0407_00430 [Desulfobacca sp.]|nr:hypothetical protein [Desulfobacca sp.]